MFTTIGAIAVPVLIDALKFGDRATQKNAARSLGRIGAGAKAAIPALNRALENDNPSVRYATALALKKSNGSANKRAVLGLSLHSP
jgi:HEAT repeat protein